MMVTYRVLATRRRRLAGIIALCVAVGVVVATLVLPQYFSNAGSNGVSTLYKTATNLAIGSKASSSDSPAGAVVGEAAPGDTIQWVVSYQNDTSAPATVNLTDNIKNAGNFIPGSVRLPPNPNGLGALTPQYSIDNGNSWVSGTAPANATGIGWTGTVVPQGTRQLSTNFPSPTANVVATSGGDAYNVVVKNGLIYGVYHHRTGNVVYCSRMDGTTCPGWPTGSNAQYWSDVIGTPIGTGTQFAGFTGWQGGTWISGNRLYWLAGVTTAASAGVACLDISTAKSCGYSVIANGQIPGFNNGAQVGSTAIPAANGNIYVAAISGATRNSIFCVSPTAGAVCAGGATLNSGVSTLYPPTLATFGDYVFASVQPTNTSSSWQTYCYRPSTNALCSGSWPVVTSVPPAFTGTPFAPILSSTGALTGICTIANGAGTSSKCWNLSGTALSNNPYAGTGAAYTGNGNGAGDTYVVGTKVYGSAGSTVFCVDFASYSGTGTVPNCTGFTRPSNSINYTVRSASDVAPNCLVATGDSGVITFFNAITGGGCTGVSGPANLTVTPTSYYCGSGAAGFKGWNALTLPGLVAGTYTNSTITLKDQNNTVISGFNGVTLAAGATLNLSSIPTSVTSITASVTVNGVNDPSGVVGGQVSITWQGSPPEMCFQTVIPRAACDATGPATISNSANAVTVSAAGNDKPGGNTTGPVSYLVSADPYQCSLLIKKTSGVQTAVPGGKVAYSVTVTNNGQLDYNNAAFSDDLTDLLKDATYNADHAATSGMVTYNAPKISWSGPLASGATVTVTYSVTVKNPDGGDHSLVNTVVSPTWKTNCAEGSKDAKCTVTVPIDVKDVAWHKVDSSASANILTGAAWTFTPVDGTGKPTGPAIVVNDCVAAFAAQCTGPDIDPIGGVFRLTDLGPGTYQLVETQAPIGFRLDPKPIPVTVTSASTTVQLPDVVNAQLPVPAIPFTGGLGTDALTFTALGVFAVALALGVWQLIRRRRNV
ncbi:MAG: prealbumin-like fold domain-containing protein [Leifsonia sp.]